MISAFVFTWCFCRLVNPSTEENNMNTRQALAQLLWKFLVYLTCKQPMLVIEKIHRREVWGLCSHSIFFSQRTHKQHCNAVLSIQGHMHVRNDTSNTFEWSCSMVVTVVQFKPVNLWLVSCAHPASNNSCDVSNFHITIKEREYT